MHDGGWSFSCNILCLDIIFHRTTTSKNNPSKHYKLSERMLLLFLEFEAMTCQFTDFCAEIMFGTYAMLTAMGQFTMYIP